MRGGIRWNNPNTVCRLMGVLTGWAENGGSEGCDCSGNSHLWEFKKFKRKIKITCGFNTLPQDRHMSTQYRHVYFIDENLKITGGREGW